MKRTCMVLNVTVTSLSFLKFLFVSFLPSLPLSLSGASRAIASGDPASSRRATMGAGAPGPSSAPAPERVVVEFAPAAGSATTLREC